MIRLSFNASSRTARAVAPGHTAPGEGIRRAGIRSCRALLALLTVAMTFHVAALEPEPVFEHANLLYEQQRFAEAVEAYQSLFQDGINSPALHFNLGNALLRAGHTGLAIYHYRLAERLAPRDPDIRANLHFARASTGLAARSAPRLQRLLHRLTLNEWTTLCAVAFWLWIGVLCLRQLFPTLRKPLGTLTAAFAAVTLILCACLGVVWHEVQQPTAIVITAPNIALRFGPFVESPEHFSLPDGAEVPVVDRHQDWIQVRDRNQRLGWLQNRDVALLPCYE
jgi:tetratricopeptide (TPR) repeat protein